MKEKTISIIIPTYNEKEYLSKTLQNVIKIQNRQTEILVVDGGSTDKTTEITSPFVKIIKSQKGRAKQMNTGAKASKGKILLFLHADTTLPEKAFLEITKIINQGKIGGGFYQKFEPTDIFLSLSSLIRNFKVTFTHLFYGDQTIFVTKKAFEKINGYDEIPILEDLYFIRKLKKIGKLGLIKKKVLTSSRKYKIGFFKLWWLYRKILWWDKKRINPEEIKRRTINYLK